MTDVLLDSLQRRMRAMHSLWYDAVATMDIDHVNHVDRDDVLPIAFSLFHYTNMQDATYMVLTGELPIWDAAWQSRVQMAIDDHGKERTQAEMCAQRVGDYDAMCEYQRTVFTRTEAWLAALDPAELDRVVVPRPLPPVVENTYSARVAGPQGVTVLDAIECWWYQHGLRHMGEVEWARGRLGLGGMTS
ncbi:MAG TPA: hypothetical protein VK866_18765 [Acidimicrobiales bacterium]|nr:hypothetical protein [Acidimicrobiales bacterium]